MALQVENGVGELQTIAWCSHLPVVLYCRRLLQNRSMTRASTILVLRKVSENGSTNNRVSRDNVKNINHNISVSTPEDVTLSSPFSEISTGGVKTLCWPNVKSTGNANRIVG